MRHLSSTLGAAALAFIGPAGAQQAAAPPSALTVKPAGANLNITPRRIVFDRATRTATVYVFNQGQEPASFDVTLVDRVMLPSGEIQALDQAGTTSAGQAAAARLASAHDMVVATPRRITLAPGKGQTIRLRAAAPPPGAPPAAEYRTHLTVANLPPPDAGLTAEEAASQRPGQLSFHIRSVFGLSIPVIVRPGAADARAAIENVRLTQIEARSRDTNSTEPVPAISLDIARTGAGSLFGNLEVRGGQRGEAALGIARGVGVYPEVDRRALQIQLRRAPRPGEPLTVIFTDDDARPGNELARASIKAP
jgi:P pilus assembly chaperone PapD